MKILLACAAASLGASSSLAQSAAPSAEALARVAAPGPTALELAELLPGVGPAAPEAASRIRGPIARRFLNSWTPRGWACDPANAECRRIAEEMAAELSVRTAEWSKRRWQVFAAHFLQASMSEADMREAIAYLRTPGGGRLAAVLGRIAEPRGDNESDFAVYARAWEAIPEPPRADFDAFHERTRHLPRHPTPPAPPPPRVENRPRSD